MHVKGHILCYLLIAILIPLSIVNRSKFLNYYTFVDWKTIVALADLLLITKGLQKSKAFDYAAKKIITKASNEKNLSILLVITTALISTLLTNDIALFIMIPLTLAITKYIENKPTKILILETFAANVGSLLTPFGNPQNMFLFHQWGLSIYMFIFNMLLLETCLIVLLLLYTLIFVKQKMIIIRNNDNSTIEVNRRLLWVSLGLFALFLVSLEFSFLFYASPAILVAYIICCKKTIIECNWSLLLIFILIFVNINLLLSLSSVENTFSYLTQGNKLFLYISGISISQVISNAPAAIFLSHFSKNWLVITYAVNVAGNGTIVSSLANLITLKLSNTEKLGMKFHLYSFPFLIISSVIGYMLLLI